CREDTHQALQSIVNDTTTGCAKSTPVVQYTPGTPPAEHSRVVPATTMNRINFDDEMRALAICAKCLEETRSLHMCTGCRMVLYCGVEHQKEHWQEHKKYCKEMRASASTAVAAASGPAPVLPGRWGPAPPEHNLEETYVSVCDGMGMFSVLGLFWRSRRASLCCLTMRLGHGVSSCLMAPLPDWDYRTRLSVIKTLTVGTTSDFVRVTPPLAAEVVVDVA
ncbi:unnamed protein product, partial [Discosporangium mesarthrocarpum]